MVKISVIIPVYNAGKKICRCLDSVINQDFKDFECIVVDDGSSDNSATVIKEYIQRDNRFIGVCKSNGGVSSARNVGLSKAKGDWIVFIDSDDYIKKNHLSVIAAATSQDIDLIAFGFEEFGNSHRTHRYNDKKYIGKSEIQKLLIYTDFVSYQTPWDKAFRNIWKEGNGNLWFDEKLHLSEDNLFNFHFLLKSRGIKTLSSIIYDYEVIKNGSLSTRIYSADINKYRYNAFVEIDRRLINHFSIPFSKRYIFAGHIEYCYSEFITALRKEKKYFMLYWIRLNHNIKKILKIYL